MKEWEIERNVLLTLYVLFGCFVILMAWTTKNAEQAAWVFVGIPAALLLFAPYSDLVETPYKQKKAGELMGKKQEEAKRENCGVYGNATFTTHSTLTEKGFIGKPYQPDKIPFGFLGKDFLSYGGDSHIITIAPTGTGKGTTAQVPALLVYDAPFFVIDPKGENAAITAAYRRDVLKHKVFIVNPFNVLQSHFESLGFYSSAFNPLAALNPDDDAYISDVATIAEAVILQEGKDPHWCNSARDLVSGLIMWVVASMPPKKRNLPTVRDIITFPKSELLVILEEANKKGDIFIKNKLARFLGDRSELDNIISTAQTQTAFLDDPQLRASLSGDDFRFLDLKRERMTVYLILPVKLLLIYAKWFRLLVGSALDSVMGSEEKNYKPVLFMLDEFPALGHMSAIENAMSVARGFGVQLWVFVQDIHKMSKLYGQGWKSFLANAGVQQFFTPNDPETAQYISDRAGFYTAGVASTTFEEKKTIEDILEYGDYGIRKNYSHIQRPLIDPQTILGYGRTVGMLFFHGNQNIVIYERKAYREDIILKSRSKENPYYSGYKPKAKTAANENKNPPPVIYLPWVGGKE